MSQKPVLPTGRAAVFTAVCVLLAVAAHTWMSGAAIPLWAVGAGLLPVFATARLMAGRERSLGTILTLMGLDQTALHALFDVAQQHAAAAATMVTSPAARIVMMPSVPLPGANAMPAVSMAGMAGMQMSGMGMSGAAAPMRMTPGMFAVHAVAALVCAWWLRRGEATVHAVVGAVAAWISDRFRLPQPGSRTGVPAGLEFCSRQGTEPTRPPTGMLRFVLARRGPPLTLSV